MPLSKDAIIFGLGFLNGPRARLSFGGMHGENRITERARAALAELIGAGYAESCDPDFFDTGREGYCGVKQDPSLGALAREAGIDPFDTTNRWAAFEPVAGAK